MYHIAKRAGQRCPEVATHDTGFCSSHRRCCNQATFFSNISLFMNGAPKLHAKNIYSCLNSLWSSYSDMSSSRLDIAFDGVELLAYVLDHQAIIAIGKRLSIPLRPHKAVAAFDIVYIMWNVWHLGRRERFVCALVVAQRRWRENRRRVLARYRGPWPEQLAINETDPFTMENVADLPLDSMFSFRGTRDEIYTFSGAEFLTYVYYHGNRTNPLTRERLDDGVITRLHAWAVLHDCWKRVDEPAHDTPTTVLTFAVAELERIHGICIHPAWLLELDEMHVVSIFSQYHLRLQAYGPNVVYLDRQAEIDSFEADNPGPSQIALGREMITMIQAEEPTSFYVCNLVLVLANFCPDLRASLPEWVRDAAEM